MNKKLIILACLILLLSFSLFIKVNTTIYVGDYSGCTRYAFDIIVKIDDKEILNDSLLSSFPYLYNFAIPSKLRCGLHTISVYSNSANIYHERRIFLLPNQYISIEFFPADTLTFRNYNFPDSVILNDIQLTDSIIETYKPAAFFYDSIFQDTIILNITEKSEFDIRTEFNPFYLE